MKALFAFIKDWCVTLCRVLKAIQQGTTKWLTWINIEKKCDFLKIEIFVSPITQPFRWSVNHGKQPLPLLNGMLSLKALEKCCKLMRFKAFFYVNQVQTGHWNSYQDKELEGWREVVWQRGQSTDAGGRQTWDCQSVLPLPHSATLG